MRELDKTKVYSLEDLTSDEYRTLYNWLLGNDSGWRYVHFESWKNNNIGFNLVHNGSNWSMQEVKPTHNAKELFYTLENIQVDCSELSDEQIKEMADVFEKSGFDMGSLYKTDNYFHLNDDNNNYCVVGSYFDNKTTITCDKFMELFGNKEENFKKLVEVLNEELTEESFKEITNSIADLLIYKNQKYGNSALNPLDIFNGKSKVGQRIDDKLARVKNSKELRKNDIADLLGYLTLVCQENGWTNFDEFKD